MENRILAKRGHPPKRVMPFFKKVDWGRRYTNYVKGKKGTMQGEEGKACSSREEGTLEARRKPETYSTEKKKTNKAK